jgi:hypothetical protein
MPARNSEDFIHRTFIQAAMFLKVSEDLHGNDCKVFTFLRPSMERGTRQIDLMACVQSRKHVSRTGGMKTSLCALFKYQI